MAEYKWIGPVREDGVKKGNMSIPAAEGNRHWKEFLEWEAQGGVADPFANRSEMEATALGQLMGEYNQELVKYDTMPASAKATRINKALRKESKGLADAADLKVLDDNDLVDTWLDQMEVRMEQDETWIEQTATDQELIDYDPTTIVWPVYPLV